MDFIPSNQEPPLATKTQCVDVEATPFRTVQGLDGRTLGL